MAKHLDPNRTDYNLGIVPDTRSPEEKEKDFQYSAIAGGADEPFKVITDLDKYSTQSQLQTSSCVWQTIAKMCEVLRYRVTSKKINHSAGGFAMRTNKPGWGTSIPEGLDQASKVGVAFEEDIPSENMTEDEMNNIPYLQLIEKIPNSRISKKLLYIPYMPLDFLTICKEINKGNVAGLLIRCNYEKEWNQAVPQIYGGYKNLSHEVSGVQTGYFTCTLRGNEGEKLELKNELVIIIDDSFGNLGYLSLGKRIITKTLFDTYCAAVCLATGITYNESVGVKPSLPATTASYGQSGPNVKALQLCLRYLGHFPNEVDLNLASNNKYGPITRFHVKQFQLEHADFFASKGTSLATLKNLDGRSFGPQSIQLLSQLII